MSRGELAIIAAALIAAIGIGMWVHPGAGMLALAVGLGAYGVMEIRFPPEQTAAAEEPEA